MLSILIPIFDFDVKEFIAELSAQARKAGIPFEILCVDDCSHTFYRKANKDLGEIEGVVYWELEENIGRSAIRNLLADKAQYPYLLFMDCDSEIKSDQFLQNYIDNIKPGLVICGGRTYAKRAPREPDLKLRWHYGSEREVISADKRREAPYRNFMTNNFLVPTEIFQSIGMDESLTQYGHEDTLFGAELKNQGIPVLHLDNPLCHVGLETAPEFISKTRQSVENLHKLIDRGQASEDIKLYRYYKLVKRWGLRPWILMQYRRKQIQIEKELTGGNPNLRKFDFYKIGYLLSLDS